MTFANTFSKSVMDFVIAIPSYDRPKILQNRTLALLERFGIPKKNIKIFLRDGEQFLKYHNSISKYIDCVVETNCTGIQDTRNFLQKYFYNNIEYSNVIYLDDDIQNIMDFDKPLECLKTLGNDIFKELAKQNLYVAGVSPYHNTFYLKKNISRSLKYVCGCFRAEIIRRDEPLILCEMGHFEDHQFSCEYFLRDGGLLRYNWIALVTKYFELEGGICGQLGGMDARQEQMEENAMVMLSLYPDMCRAVEKQYGFDIRLNHNYKIK